MERAIKGKALRAGEGLAGAAAGKRGTAGGTWLARLLPYLALAAIAGLALALRWDRLQYAEFSADQAWVLNRARDFVLNGDFPLAGILTSVGSAQGPVEIYLLAIPALFSADPVVASGFVGLLQGVAVVGTYFFTSKYYGRTAGLIAAALFAVNPWALQHARKIYTPNLLPLFSLLFFAAVYGAVVDRRRYHLSLACLGLAVMFLVHPQAVVFAPLLLMVVVVFWRRLGWRPLLLGVSLALLAASPYLYYEAQRGFASFKVYLGVSGAAASHFGLESLGYVLAMASAAGYPSVLGFTFRGDWSLPDLTVGNAVATALLLLGLGICVWQLVAWRRGRRQEGEGWEKYALPLLWLSLPVVVTLRHSIDLWPYYFVGVYPGQFVLLGLALARAGEFVARRAPALALPSGSPRPFGESVGVRGRLDAGPGGRPQGPALHVRGKSPLPLAASTDAAPPAQRVRGEAPLQPVGQGLVHCRPSGLAGDETNPHPYPLPERERELGGGLGSGLASESGGLARPERQGQTLDGGLALPRVERRWLGGALVGAVLLYMMVSQVGLFGAFLDNTVQLGPQRPYGIPLLYSQQGVNNLRMLRDVLGNPPIYLYAFNYRIPMDYLARPDLTLHHVDPP
ncbi:MAG: glycosyltransferase family 39 protein, partial [Dehalococcoidales bacterium]|nr:glycosyltransferase family 39 protein [Dehalococcoidales bacterium]